MNEIISVVKGCLEVIAFIVVILIMVQYLYKTYSEPEFRHEASKEVFDPPQLSKTVSKKRIKATVIKKTKVAKIIKKNVRAPKKRVPKPASSDVNFELDELMKNIDQIVKDKEDGKIIYKDSTNTDLDHPVDLKAKNSKEVGSSLKDLPQDLKTKDNVDNLEDKASIEVKSGKEEVFERIDSVLRESIDLSPYMEIKNFKLMETKIYDLIVSSEITKHTDRKKYKEMINSVNDILDNSRINDKYVFSKLAADSIIDKFFSFFVNKKDGHDVTKYISRIIIKKIKKLIEVGGSIDKNSSTPDVITETKILPGFKSALNFSELGGIDKELEVNNSSLLDVKEIETKDKKDEVQKEVTTKSATDEMTINETNGNEINELEDSDGEIGDSVYDHNEDGNEQGDYDSDSESRILENKETGKSSETSNPVGGFNFDATTKKNSRPRRRGGRKN